MDWNDETAIADIRKGGEQGAQYIFEQYGGRLLSIFIKKSLSRADAEDVLQETLWRFFTSVRQHKYTEQGTLFAYLAKIGSREVIRKIQQNSPKNEGDDENGTNEIDQIPSETQLEKEICYRICVTKALNKFETKEKNAKERLLALTLQGEGWLITEIAEKIGRNANATKEFLRACRQKLKRYVQHCLDDCDKL
jgi:RNA polymerase sigma factor (sigma-70 family)